MLAWILITNLKGGAICHHLRINLNQKWISLAPKVKVVARQSSMPPHKKDLDQHLGQHLWSNFILAVCVRKLAGLCARLLPMHIIFSAGSCVCTYWRGPQGCCLSMDTGCVSMRGWVVCVAVCLFFRQAFLSCWFLSWILWVDGSQQYALVYCQAYFLVKKVAKKHPSKLGPQAQRPFFFYWGKGPPNPLSYQGKGPLDPSYLRPKGLRGNVLWVVNG